MSASRMRPRTNAPPHGEDEFIPGTRQLYDGSGNSLSRDSALQTSSGILLVPQPTTSPNDPLRWSLWRKAWHSLLVLYMVGLTAATSNNAGSGSDGVNEEYGISYDVFNTGAGVLFLGIGYWALLSSPLVHLYGRRLGYLASLVLNIGGLVWYARIENVSGVVWSQLFVGAAESVGEATAQLSLLDIWFEHQTGSVLGMYTFATAIGTYLGPLIGAYVAQGLGWRWIGYVGAIICGASLVVFYFGLEETEFQRQLYLTNNEDHVVHDAGQPVDQSSQVDVDAEKAPRDPATELQTTPSSTHRKTYWNRIRVITLAPNLRGTGFKQYLNRLWHTLRVFTFPAVWYAGLQWGFQQSCLTF